MENTTKFVPYYRVSTEKQGDSGLGIESQKKFVRDYCLKNGAILQEFSDVFTGTSAEREGLTKAIELCKASGAALVAYDITRISRGGLNVRWILEKSGIKFLGALSPHDSSFSMGIQFEVAKEERDRTARNTKKALNEIKEAIERDGYYISRSGNKIDTLGNPDNLSDYSRERSAESRKKKARNNENNKAAYAVVKVLRDETKKTYKQIAQSLNDAGLKTPKGGSFSAMQVKRVYELYAV